MTKKGSSGSKGGSKSPAVHTTPNSTGKGWVNKVGGEVESKHRKKDNAIDKGRDIAKEQGSEHVIHKQDGTIQGKNSYGNDPKRSKG